MAYLQQHKVEFHLISTQIHSNSFATRLIFDDRDATKVIGVTYIKNGEYMVAYANNDVILSAGTMHTPGKHLPCFPLSALLAFFTP
jgi:regulator of extracellular matrix RemA (YlzA/DUF370 family)